MAITQRFTFALNAEVKNQKSAIDCKFKIVTISNAMANSGYRVYFFSEDAMKLLVDLSAGQKAVGGHQSNGIEKGLSALAETIGNVLEENGEIEEVILYGLFGKTGTTGNNGFFDEEKKLPKPLDLEFSRSLRCEEFRTNGLAEFVAELKTHSVRVAIVVGSPCKDAQLKRVELDCRAKRDWNAWHEFVATAIAQAVLADCDLIFDGVTISPAISPSFAVYSLAKNVVIEYGGRVGVFGSVSVGCDATRAALPVWRNERIVITYHDWLTKHSTDRAPSNAEVYPLLEGETESPYSYPVTVVTSDLETVERITKSGAIPCLTLDAYNTPDDGESKTPDEDGSAGDGEDG